MRPILIRSYISSISASQNNFGLRTASARPPGYLKALELGNNVPRQKGFCEADKVNFSAVLLQNPNCRNLRVIDTLIIYENIGFH